MNLEKLFNAQKQLDEFIIESKGLEGQDLLDKKILALLVELGELANEWRGFKFWSENQSPKPMSMVISRLKHPMLIEYVDCLHFILSIGMDLEVEVTHKYAIMCEEDLTSQFNSLYTYGPLINGCNKEKRLFYYQCFIRWFIGLGEKLGFTWEQIENAYFEKHAINIQRQETGY